MEIERKFLLSGVPPTMRFARREPIRQGYLALDGDTEVRLRITAEGAVLTIKSGRGGVRVEEEIALQTRQAEALWELTEGRRVQKARRKVRLAGPADGPELIAEVDEYSGALDGLVVVEVEFPDEDDVAWIRTARVVRPRADRRLALRQPQPRQRRDA